MGGTKGVFCDNSQPYVEQQDENKSLLSSTGDKIERKIVRFAKEKFIIHAGTKRSSLESGN